MKKRWISLLVALALTVSAFAGCGSGDTVPAADDNSASSGEGNGELEYAELDWYLDLGEKPDISIVNDTLNEYLMEKINTKVNLHILSADEYATKLPTMLSAGQDVGIVTYNSSVNYTVHTKQGSFFPLNDLLDQYGTGIKGEFSDDVWNAMRIDGEIYGIPALKDNCYIMNMIYNEEMAEELGLDMEGLEFKNWRGNEDFFTQALQLRNEKHPEMEGKPLLMDIASEFPYYFNVETFLGNNYTAVCNISGIDDVAGYGSDTAFNLYATDEYREFCLMKQRMVENGVYAYDYADYPDSLYDGSLLACAGWGFTYISDHLYSDTYTTRLKVAENVWTDTNNYIGTGSAIAANCADPERAMMVLELVNTDSYIATMLRFGVEGEHWVIDDNGNMTMEGSSRNSGDPVDRGYYYWYGASFGNLTVVDAPEDLTGPDNIMMKKIVEYNNSAILPEHMGFVLNTDPITNEIAACSNVISEYASTLAKGQYDSQDAVNQAVDDFNQKLKDNGVDRILTEVQSQLDAWSAENK